MSEIITKPSMIYIPYEKLDIDKHISFTSSQEVREICEPAFRFFKLQHFHFCRFYKGSAVGQKIIFPLSTCRENLLGTQNNIQDICTLNYHSPLLTYSFFDKWVESIGHNSIRKRYEKQLRMQFGDFAMGTEFSVKRITADYVDGFDFSAKPVDANAVNRFLSNIDAIEKFIDYFYQRAAKLLNQGNTQGIAYHTKDSNVWLSEAALNGSQEKLSFLNAIDLTSRSQSRIKLTKRESDCARILLLGGTAKSIAHALDISARTVETHLINLKQKLGCYSKVELVKRLHDLKLIQL